MKLENDADWFWLLLGLALIAAGLLGTCARDLPDRHEPDLGKASKIAEVVEIASVSVRPYVKPWSSPAPPEIVLLARILVSEAGWLTPNGSNENDGPAILLVLLRRAQTQGWTLRQAMERYSARATGARPARSARGRWVASLSESSAVPLDWPLALPWAGGYLARWKARLREARRLLSDTSTTLGILTLRQTTCNGEWPDHWGGAMDDSRAIGEDWVRASCGRTHNHYWIVPRLLSSIPAEIARGRR